ncbi:Zf-BED domain-containing protein [Quillaja saponaria]|uniref:Zf-BED domain-containing protein n=1 Tax=Quillaja saponaria TaxID=32244 RepID=A0AAD7M3L3_QUISA|nr:Zf-BED domain-containing protein [Quillaja saponaria]
MNDIVFVMYNCKLNERQTKKYSSLSLRLDDLSSDDEWITLKEDPVDFSSNEWLHVLDGSSNVNDDVIDVDAPLDEEVQVVEGTHGLEGDVGFVGGDKKVVEVMSVGSDEGGNFIDNEDDNDDNDNGDDDIGNGDYEGGQWW